MSWKKIKVKRIDGLPVWHVTSADRVTLAMTFIRMQEWYESANPDFCGKVFTLKKFKEWYASERDGNFSYTHDWSGFNVPSIAVRAVYDNFSGHSKEERKLFKKLERLGVFEHDQFYLIGSKSSDPATLAHELRHALYFTNSEYRRDVDHVTEQFPVHSLRRCLVEMGYSTSVIPDEVQAYALTGFPSGLRVSKEMRKLKTALHLVEKKYLHLLPKGCQHNT